MAKWWTKKRVKVAAFTGLGVIAAGVAGVVVYFSIPMRAAGRELTQAQNLLTVRYSDAGSAIVLKPAIKATKGLLLYPGGRVDPAAYAYKMSEVALTGIEVIIVRPPLHLAPLDFHKPSFYTDLAPSVTEWYVAGHSVGGVKACQIVHDNPSQFKGLILLGAYCPDSIAATNIKALSIGGANDKLTTPQDIDANKNRMPADTKYEMIQGLNHAGFGDYGKQGGDGDAAINTADARAQLGSFITSFIGVPAPPQK